MSNYLLILIIIILFLLNNYNSKLIEGFRCSTKSYGVECEVGPGGVDCQCRSPGICKGVCVFPSTKEDYYCGEIGGIGSNPPTWGYLTCKKFIYENDAKNYFGCANIFGSDYRGMCEEYGANYTEDTSWDNGCFFGFKRIKCKLKNPPAPAPPAPAPPTPPAPAPPYIKISENLSINNCNK